MSSHGNRYVALCPGCHTNAFFQIDPGPVDYGDGPTNDRSATCTHCGEIVIIDGGDTATHG